MGRGGKRVGAGAPRKPHKKRAVLVGLPPDLLDGLAELPGSRAHLIEQACREHYGIIKPEELKGKVRPVLIEPRVIVSPFKRQ